MQRANILNCQNQTLNTLPATVLQKTDWLLMSGNNLGIINKAPVYLENITLLNLSSNNIHEIDETVMKIIVHNIKSLDIRQNKLKTLPESIAKANKTIRLWVSNNPYECNCDMIWMKDWLIDAENVQDKENVTCSGSKLKGEITSFFYHAQYTNRVFLDMNFRSKPRVDKIILLEQLNSSHLKLICFFGLIELHEIKIYS